jgi:hypothetical protein
LSKSQRKTTFNHQIAHQTDPSLVVLLGVANYFIDLAIRHPNRPEIYLLSLECGGATYHSARSARDRDKYRQAVLEGLGRQIYRIWSTD